MNKFQLCWGYASFWSFVFVFHLQGDNYRRRLFIENVSLNHSGYRCRLSCIHIRFLSQIHPLVNALNHMPSLTWQPLWDEQASAEIQHHSQKNANWEVVSYLMLLHDPPPPPKHPSTSVSVVESHAVLGTGRAVYMQAWSSKDSTETDACQR